MKDFVKTLQKTTNLTVGKIINLLIIFEKNKVINN